MYSKDEALCVAGHGYGRHDELATSRWNASCHDGDVMPHRHMDHTDHASSRKRHHRYLLLLLWMWRSAAALARSPYVYGTSAYCLQHMSFMHARRQLPNAQHYRKVHFTHSSSPSRRRHRSLSPSPIRRCSGIPARIISPEPSFATHMYAHQPVPAPPMHSIPRTPGIRNTFGGWD